MWLIFFYTWDQGRTHSKKSIGRNLREGTCLQHEPVDLSAKVQLLIINKARIYMHL